MSTRYNKIFSLKGNLYTQDAPVIIMAGAIQLDNYKDKAFIQLKIKNISLKKIKSARVTLNVGKSADGEPLLVDYLYEGLDVNPDDAFGEKLLIPLEIKSTKEFSLASLELTFEDGEVYNSGDAVWRAIKQKSIVKLIPDYYQQVAYGARYGKRATKISVGNDTLWLCTCGTPHPASASACNVCSAKKEELASIDTDALRREGALIVARTRSDGKTLSELREAKEAIDTLPSEIETYDLRNKIYGRYKEFVERKKKRTTIALATAIPSLLLVVALFLTVFLFVPMSKYKKANELYADGKYYEACAKYIEIENYKDSQKKMAMALYLANLDAMDYSYEGDFINAYNTIKGFYEDEEVYNYLYGKINCVDIYGSYIYDYMGFDYYDDYENWRLWSDLVYRYDLELDEDYYEYLLEMYEIQNGQSSQNPTDPDDTTDPDWPLFPIDPDDVTDPDDEQTEGSTFDTAIDITGLSQYTLSTSNVSVVYLKFTVPYYSTVTLASSFDGDLDAYLYSEDGEFISLDESLGDFYITAEAFYGETLYLEIYIYSTVSSSPATVYISFD